MKRGGEMKRCWTWAQKASTSIQQMLSEARYGFFLLYFTVIFYMFCMLCLCNVVFMCPFSNHHHKIMYDESFSSSVELFHVRKSIAKTVNILKYSFQHSSFSQNKRTHFWAISNTPSPVRHSFSLNIRFFFLSFFALRSNCCHSQHMSSP